MRGLADIFLEVVLIIAAIVAMIFLLVYAFGILGTDFSRGEHEATPDTVIFSLSQPEVSENRLEEYLEGNAGVSLAGEAGTFYAYGMMHDIDPAFAVAVAKVETDLGRAGCGGSPAGCNNHFCLLYDEVRFTKLSKGKCGSTEFASFSGAKESIEAFFMYIEEKYVDKRDSQDTISKIGCIEDSWAGNCYCTFSGSECGKWTENVRRATFAIRGTEPA